MWALLAICACVVFAAVLWHRYVSSGLLAEDVRGTVVTTLQRSLGRPVSLGGVSGDMRGEIRLRDLRIAERGGFDRGVAFSADSIRLTLNVGRLLTFHPDLVGSITRAELDRPHLSLSRDAAGVWSVADLMAARRGSAAASGFHGRIVVRDGSLVFADALGIPNPPFVARFARITGEAGFGRGHEILLRFSGWTPEQEGIALNGRYRSDAGTADLDLTAVNGDVAHWGGYFVRARQLAWSGGRFGGRVRVALASSASGLRVDFAATLRLHDADAQYGPAHLWLRHASGPLTVDSMHAETSGLTLLANGSPLWVEGNLVYGGGPWVQLDLKSSNLDLATVQALFFPKARPALTGQAAGEVQIMGPVGALDVDGEITSAQGKLDRQPFDSLYTRFQYAGGTLALSRLRAAVGGGRLAGEVVVSMAEGTPSYLFSGSTEHVDVHALASAGLLGLDSVTGQVSGHVVGAGSGSRVQLMGDVTMQAGSVRGLAFDALHALFWEDAGSLDLDYLSSRVGAATIYTSGHIGAAGALDLDVWARDVPLAELGERAGMSGTPLSGSINLDGRATGTTASPVLSGTVTASNGQVGPIPFALAHGDLTVTPAGVQAQHLVLQDGMARYEVNGGLTFHPLAATDLRISAEDIDVEGLARSLPALPEITGTLSADLSFDGPLAHPAVSGQLALDHGSVAGRSFDHAEVHLATDGRQVRLTGAELRLNDSRLFAQGTIDPEGPLDLQLWARDVPLRDVSATLGLGLTARGTLSLSGGVRGTLGTPEVYGMLWSTDLNVGGEAFDALGTLDYRSGVLRVNSLQIAHALERYELSGTLRLGARPSGDLTFNVEQGQIATLLRLSGLTLPARLDGTFDGRVQLSGPLADPSAHLTLALHDARFGAYAIGTGVADLTLTHQAIDIQRFEIRPEQGQLEARGQVNLRGVSSVEVAAADLNPDFLRPFFHLDRPLEGNLSFTLQFSGQMQDPTVGLSFEARNAGVGGVLADRIAGYAYYQKETLHIEEGLITKGPHKIRGAGTLPIQPGTLALDPQAPVQLQFRLQDADLSLLTLLTPEIQDAAGTVEGEITIGGKVSDPQMSGYLRSSSGHLRYVPLRTPLEDVRTDLAFSQNEIQVHDLSATLGGGRVQVDGVIGVHDLRLADAHLAVSAHAVALDLPGAYKGQADADLKVTGPVSQPTLSGKVILSQGQVTPTGEFGRGVGTSGFARTLNLDLTLEAGQKVGFTLGAIRSDIQGQLHVGGTLAAPELSGRITASQGAIAFMGSAFTLTEGEAVFSESLGVEPVISAHAQAAYGSTLVFLDASGVASHPNVTLTSDPPMAQSEVVGLVARNAGITGDPATVLGQGVGRFLLGPIGEALHLNELTIAYSPESPVTFRIGKFLLRNIYLTLSEVVAQGPPGTVAPTPTAGTLTHPVTTQSYTMVGLEYLLSPSVTLSYNVDTLGGSGVFLLTRFPL